MHFFAILLAESSSCNWLRITTVGKICAIKGGTEEVALKSLFRTRLRNRPAVRSFKIKIGSCIRVTCAPKQQKPDGRTFSQQNLRTYYESNLILNALLAIDAEMRFFLWRIHSRLSLWPMVLAKTACLSSSSHMTFLK